MFFYSQTSEIKNKDLVALATKVLISVLIRFYDAIIFDGLI